MLGHKEGEISSTWSSGKVEEKRLPLLSLEEYPVEVCLKRGLKRIWGRVSIMSQGKSMKKYSSPRISLCFLGLERKGESGVQ